MITFEVTQMLRRKRWIMVILIYLASISLACLTLHWPKQDVINQWDIVFWVLSYTFIGCALVPITFFYFISDIVTQDLDGYIAFTLTRVKSRSSWYIAKLFSVWSAALIFTCLIAVLSVVSGLLFHEKFSWKWSGYERDIHSHAFIGTAFLHIPPETMLIESLGLLLIGLTAMGVLMITISLFSRNAFVSLGIGVILSIASYAIWMGNASFFPFMPTAQFVLFNHYPFNSAPGFQSFTFAWSLGYDLIVLITSLIIGWLRVIRMDLS